MPETRLTPAQPGRLNKPAWFRRHCAAFGPVRKAPSELGPVTIYDVYLDGKPIGSVTGTLRSTVGTLRAWAPDRCAPGVRQHGVSRFEAVDALVRTHLTATQQHPIAA